MAAVSAHRGANNGPSVVGVAFSAFRGPTMRLLRTLLTAGSDNRLPTEIFGMTTPVTWYPYDRAILAGDRYGAHRDSVQRAVIWSEAARQAGQTDSRAQTPLAPP